MSYRSGQLRVSPGKHGARSPLEGSPRKPGKASLGSDLDSPRIDPEEQASLTGREVSAVTSSYLQSSSDEESSDEASSFAQRCARRCCCALLVLVLASVLLHFSVNYMVRQGVISGLSYLFGYHADCESVDVSIMTGHTRLLELSVGNPPNFTGNFLQVGEGLIDARFGTVISNPVWVNSLELIDLVLTVEQQGTSSNVQIIVDSFENITGFPRWLEDVTLVIEHLSIANITVRCSGFIDTTVTIDDIVIDDIGKPDGVSVRDVASVAVNKLWSHAMAQGPLEMRQAFHAGVQQVEHRIQNAAHAVEAPFLRAAHTLTSAVGLHPTL